MTSYTQRLLAWFRWGVTTRLDRIEQTLQALKANDDAHRSDMAQLKTQGTQIMAAIDNLTAAEARIAAALDKSNARLDELMQRDTDLAAQLAAALAAGDTTALNASVQAVADRLNADAATTEQHLTADADPAPVAPAPADPVPAAPDSSTPSA